MNADKEYANYEAGSEDLVQKLVVDHHGWATSIARSVARSWNLDWQLDGLDGGAYEGLLFCARRFDPKIGVPFKAYARRRIHEASTEEARKSKSWQQAVGANTQADQESREISAKLFEMFPELRDGLLPSSQDSDQNDMRGSIRQLLTSATMLSALNDLGQGSAERAIDFKRLVVTICELDRVHQEIIWGIYYEGKSMRALATEWELDELSIIREHKEILKFIFDSISVPNKRLKKLKIRPSLREYGLKNKTNKWDSPFEKILTGELAISLSLILGMLRILDSAAIFNVIT